MMEFVKKYVQFVIQRASIDNLKVNGRFVDFLLYHFSIIGEGTKKELIFMNKLVHGIIRKIIVRICHIDVTLERK